MTPAQFACLARGLLDGPMVSAALCAALEDSVVERGAYDADAPGEVLRASGGAAGFAGVGVLALAWRIPRDPLVTPEKLLNLACRPLLHWLKGMKVPASYFGRDSLSVPDGEVVRLGLTGSAEAYLLEARVAHTVTLDVPDAPPLVWKKPGDRKPGRTLVSLSRHVPRDVETLQAGLMEVLRQSGAEPASPSEVPPVARARGALGAGVPCALGLVRASAEGRVVGPFMASRALVDDVERGMTTHGNPSRAVLEALSTPGAFLLGADAEHLVAALQEARRDV